MFGRAGSPLHEVCGKNGLAFIACKNKKLNKKDNYFYLKQLVKELKPDVIHLHTSDSLTVYTIADMLLGLKTKTIFAKKGMGSSSSLLSKFKYNYKNIAALLCVSKKVQTDFSKILSDKNKKKTVVIYDCVSTHIMENKGQAFNLREKYNLGDKAIIGNIANHTKAKDLFTLIDTVDYMVNVIGNRNVAFIQIGEFSGLTDELLALVKEKGLEDFIFYTDIIEEAYGYNFQFDAFIMTSEREGGPTSVLEAMLMGTPVVSTNVGIVPEVITDGINGFVAEVKDSKALAEKLNTLLSDKELQQKFTAISKEKILENNAADAIAKRTLEIYKSIQ